MAVFFALASWARGVSTSYEITVEAGRYERKNVPVRVPMPRNPIGTEPIQSATVAGSDGQPIPVQWTGPSLASSAAGELHFVLPHLAASVSTSNKRLKKTTCST